MTDCVFCKIVAGAIPASIVYRDATTIAFMDIGQLNPGHVIVATTAHVENIYGLDAVGAGALFQTAARVAQAVKATIRPAGMTLLQANEPAGAQTVMHVHFHVVPRHPGDGIAVSWPAKNPPRAELDRLAAVIRGGLG